MNIVEKENKKRNLSSGIVQGNVDILEQILSMSRFFFSYKFLFIYKLSKIIRAIFEWCFCLQLPLYKKEEKSYLVAYQ